MKTDIALLNFLREKNSDKLPDRFRNSFAISSLDLDLGMFPTKSLVLGTETFTFRALPSAISRELS